VVITTPIPTTLIKMMEATTMATISIKMVTMIMDRADTTIKIMIVGTKDRVLVRAPKRILKLLATSL
jgi:hypothetical protein